jgi:hypothetical protein
MSSNKLNAELRSDKGEYSGPNRHGESGLVPPRSRCFYFNGGKWFFKTREQITMAPYNSFREAEQALKLYLRRCGIVRYQSESCFLA